MSTTTGSPVTPAPGARRRSDERRPGDLLVRIGVVLFAVGAAGTIATVAPLFLGAHALPTAAYLVAMVMPVGMAVALVGMLVAGLAQRTRTRSPHRPATPDPADAAPTGRQ